MLAEVLRCSERTVSSQQCRSDPEFFFCEGGQRGGALIIIVGGGYEILRVLYPGSGAKPQPLFTVIMLLERVFVVFISSARHKTPPL